MPGGADFSQEAIGELLSNSEEHRADTVVILAGYGDKMDELLKCNPGLTGRFPNRYTFDDYQPLELLEIAKRMATGCGMVLAEDALELLQSTLLVKPLPGNARDVRNLLEGARAQRATRAVEGELRNDPVTGALIIPSQEDLAALIAADFTLPATPLALAALAATPALARTLDGSRSAAAIYGDPIEARALPQPSSTPHGRWKPEASHLRNAPRLVVVGTWQAAFIDALVEALGRLYERRELSPALRRSRLTVFERLAARETAAWGSWPYLCDLKHAVKANCNMPPTHKFLVAFNGACERAFGLNFAFRSGVRGHADASLRTYHTDELAEL